MAERPARAARALHPIPFIDEVMQALAPGRREPVELSADAEPRLRSALLALTESDALEETVSELCLLALWLGATRGSPGARDRLLALARGTLPALRARRARRPTDHRDRPELRRLLGEQSAVPAGPRRGEGRRLPAIGRPRR